MFLQVLRLTAVRHKICMDSPGGGGGMVTQRYYKYGNRSWVNSRLGMTSGSNICAIWQASRTWDAPAQSLCLHNRCENDRRPVLYECRTPTSSHAIELETMED